MVESGLTEFEIKRKKIEINLEPRKSYYLRTELIFLERPNLSVLLNLMQKKNWILRKSKEFSFIALSKNELVLF